MYEQKKEFKHCIHVGAATQFLNLSMCDEFFIFLELIAQSVEMCYSLFCGVVSPLRKGVDNMESYVTYEGLFLFISVLISLVALVVSFFKNKK